MCKLSDKISVGMFFKVMKLTLTCISITTQHISIITGTVVIVTSVATVVVTSTIVYYTYIKCCRME